MHSSSTTFCYWTACCCWNFENLNWNSTYSSHSSSSPRSIQEHQMSSYPTKQNNRKSGKHPGRHYPHFIRTASTRNHGSETGPLVGFVTSHVVTNTKHVNFLGSVRLLHTTQLLVLVCDIIYENLQFIYFFYSRKKMFNVFRFFDEIRNS